MNELSYWKTQTKNKNFSDTATVTFDIASAGL